MTTRNVQRLERKRIFQRIRWTKRRKRWQDQRVRK